MTRHFTVDAVLCDLDGTLVDSAPDLAVATDAWLIPIAVSSGQCWPRRSFSFIPGKIDVSIGTPINASGGDPETLMRQVESWIEGEMRRIDPTAYTQEKPGTDGASADGG